MRDLAAHFCVDASYITALVDDLEQAGLAERRPHGTDRRVKTVALTEKGAQVQRGVVDVMQEPPACFDALTGTEQRQLRDLVAKLIEADARLGGEGGMRHAGHGTA
jgi:DNA-binding MarR family transcriptional regulator